MIHLGIESGPGAAIKQRNGLKDTGCRHSGADSPFPFIQDARVWVCITGRIERAMAGVR